MTPQATEWEDYLHAAERKIAIARFHRECLIQELTKNQGHDGTPPIPIQVYFEGVVTALVGAFDKIAEAAKRASGNNWPNSKLISNGFQYLGQFVPDVKRWFEDPLFGDMREVRRRVIHHVYTKQPAPHCWRIESVGRDYTGSRDLLDYCSACLDFGERLNHLLPRIKAELTRIASQLRRKED